MADDGKRQQQPIETMTISEIEQHVKQHTNEQRRLIAELINRASIGVYAEEQNDELLTLIEETIVFLEELTPFPVEWVGRRNELLARLRRKL